MTHCSILAGRIMRQFGPARQGQCLVGAEVVCRLMCSYFRVRWMVGLSLWLGVDWMVRGWPGSIVRSYRIYDKVGCILQA